MDKNTLRKVYLEKRKFLSQAEYERRNQLLSARLIAFFKTREFQCVHTFVPIKKNKEPDTFPFIQYLWTEKPYVNVITGISDLKKPAMYHVEIKQDTSFLENSWGIPEPQDGVPFPVEKIQMVLVPMVTGSKNGHRIGYGKGYYDRFLQKCSQDTLLVGINLAPLLDGSVFVDQYDIPMQYMITPFEEFKLQ
ncbi:5-formyltetrahydrofolate cyclo-ligase [Marivirga sericea]|uniref:5-formyltetrahydrofolate cyclo-ligase n=1 Tax=Marivirga sericea TaxID=1028 RepID=A0A1X7KKM0_9BACT|nr:5-formyltetrahydrofolate cyclo-ligase [Marivirga sericea]SMG41945.1 5-formyltetrahydrofolate cyclo-ligase [Marivirga sericea]